MMVYSWLWFASIYNGTSQRSGISDLADSKNLIDNEVPCYCNKASYLHDKMRHFFCYGHHILSRLAGAKAFARVRCLMLSLDHEIIIKLSMEASLVDACYASKEH